MSENSPIEWTHHTFNPWWGCTEVSPACDECYARTWAARFGVRWGAGQLRRLASEHYWTAPFKWDRKAASAGARHRVFCASMADVFDNEIPDTWRERLWPLIRLTPHLDWLLLTKRIGNALKMLPSDWDAGYPNVWLLATVANQAEADRDVRKLLAIPAAIHGLSIEPMLGPIDFTSWKMVPHPLMRFHCPRCDADTHDPACPAGGSEGHPRAAIDLVICGGENARKARPIHPDWVRSLRDQCIACGTAFHFKQWGTWWPISQMPHGVSDQFFDPRLAKRERDPHDSRPLPRAVRSTVLQLDGTQRFAFPAGAMTCYSVGKKQSGRMLDGRTWDEMPRAAS